MPFGPFFVGELITYLVTVKDKDTGDVIDLTSYSAPKFMLRKKGASVNRETDAGNEDGTIKSPATDGQVEYTLKSAWGASEVGSWTMQVQLTTGGQTRKTEKVGFPVEVALEPST